MKLFKNQNKLVDERIVNTRNKIYKEAYILAIAISFISMIVKAYVYGNKSVLSEFLIIVIPGIYFGIRTICLGIYSDEVEVHDRTSKMPMSSKNMMVGLVSAVVMAVTFGVRSSILYGNSSNRLWYFFIVFVATIMIYGPFFIAVMLIWNAMAKQVSKKASQEEQD